MSETAAPGPRLPIEVIERVIDQIHDLLYDDWYPEDRRDAWKACALTCRAMRPRSQNWLFRKIELQSKCQAENLKPILQKNKQVAKKVEVLALEGPDSSEDAKDYTWISWVPFVFAPLMVNLHHLELHFDVFTNAHPRFLSAITAFKSICRLRLFDVKFPRFGHFTALIRAFPKLRHLDLNDISWNADPAHLQLLHGANRQRCTRRPVQIAHLDLWDEASATREIYRWLSDMKTTKGMRTVFVWENAFNPMLNYHPSGEYCLQSVFLVKPLPIPAVPANSLNSLQTLYIDTRRSDFPTKVLTSILSSTPRALHKVMIYIQDPNDSHTDRLISEEEATAYTRLDSALCHSSLKELKMTVWLYNKGATIEARDRWQQRLVARLPKFCASEEKLEVTRNSTLKYAYLRWVDHRDGLYDLDE